MASGVCAVGGRARRWAGAGPASCRPGRVLHPVVRRGNRSGRVSRGCGGSRAGLAVGAVRIRGADDARGRGRRRRGHLVRHPAPLRRARDRGVGDESTVGEHWMHRRSPPADCWVWGCSSWRSSRSRRRLSIAPRARPARTCSWDSNRTRRREAARRVRTGTSTVAVQWGRHTRTPTSAATASWSASRSGADDARRHAVHRHSGSASSRGWRSGPWSTWCTRGSSRVA